MDAFYSSFDMFTNKQNRSKDTVDECEGRHDADNQSDVTSGFTSESWTCAIRHRCLDPAVQDAHAKR